MDLAPREYQLRAVENCRAEFASGARSCLLVLPTGAGKTLVGSLVVDGAVKRGKRVLWVAHRRELVAQAQERMPVRSGTIMAGVKPDRSAMVQVASVDTLASWSEYPPADLIVADESHHAVASTWRGMFARYPNAKLLGLTATPSRSDGSALGDVFDRMVVGVSVRELTDQGFLVEADVIAPAEFKDSLASDPVEAWLKYADGRPGFLFCRTVKHSIECAEKFNSLGVPSRHVDGKTAKRLRDKTLAEFRAGKVDVLCSVGVFTEGTDLPRAAVCMLARGCDHAGLYLQMAGRVLRPSPGKKRALIVDLIGVCHKHGLVDDDREWSLSGEPIRLKPREESLTQCPQCGAVWRADATRVCKRCGWEMPAPEAPPVVERELTDVRESLRGILRPEADHSAKRATLERLRATAQDKGYSSGWIGMRFKAIFGHWPQGGGNAA